MLITVGFDCYAKTLQCDNLELSEFHNLQEEFENWLYEEKKEHKGCFCVKKSLNIKILDTSVVIKFFEENYPNCNVKVVNDKICIEDIDESIPIITL